MAGLTGRMSTVVKAKVSKLLDRAEDPAETLDYSYQKQVEQLQNVKKGIADVVTAKKRLQMQESSLQQSVVKLDTQARQALVAGQRGARPRGAGAQERRPDRAAVARHAGHRTRRPAGEADRVREETARQDRSLPHQEGGHQGAVLGRRGAGADLRGRHRRRRADGRRRAWRCSARWTRPRTCAPAPTPCPELEAAGTFDDITQLGSGEDDIDRQLKELSSQPRRRRRAGEDEGANSARAAATAHADRLRRGRAGRRERPGMIVRISGEDQSDLADEDSDAAQRARERGRRGGRRRRRGRLSQTPSPRCSTTCARTAREFADDELEGSDVILPPSDISLRRRPAADFTGEGLIPD